ncbi:MAG TPA: hypothetical protein VH253_01660 [Phycisphaerae bacterium]|nr:hypothetical protein [Phycisphaerae bacterium]
MRVFESVIFAIGCAAILSCAHTERSSPVTSLPEYDGQTRTAVEAILGRPGRTDTFPMSQAVGEFRVPLLNTYPRSNPANAKVMIEESWWDDGDYWITLWFHRVNGQWVVLDSCRWRKDVEF